VKRKIAVVGARGYSGLECCRLLLNHPDFELAVVTSSETSWRLSDEFPGAKLDKVAHLNTDEFLAQPKGVDAVMLATTAAQSFEAAQSLKDQFVVDLSGAFRLGVQETKAFYSLSLASEKDSAESRYGLCPWQRAESKGLVSNPGCYPTSVLMALLPLLKDGLVHGENIVIDAKSGVTGAGRSPKEIAQFAELSESLIPYKIGEHQHQPEIKRFIKHFAGMDPSFTFTTTLVPISRGILSSIYVQAAAGANMEKIAESYRNHYGEYSLFDFYAYESGSELTQLSLKKVAGTNRTRVVVRQSENGFVIFSMIDNLLKGAASQAIENLNRHFKFPIGLGLD